MKKTAAYYFCFLLFFSFSAKLFSQPVPSEDEKIPYLQTFSKSALAGFGDDDFVQIFFFVVPENCKEQVFIKVFDPEVGGKIDENRGGFNSKTRFTVYGGAGAHSAKEAKTNTPTGNYKTGISLATKTFDGNAEYDQKWYVFGPFNPLEGELQKENGGYVFKIIIEGLDGDDGNLYKMFLSKEKDKNVAVEGGNSFSYEYSFRLADTKTSISHIYPFIGGNVTAVEINIYDYDDDGVLRVVTVGKKGLVFKSPTDGVWSQFKCDIVTDELNTSMDIQFIKKKDVKKNNTVVFITNQYKELLPFYTVPIGGVPKFKYKIKVTPGK